MDKRRFDSGWIDRYLRDELTAEQQEAFETALLDSPELQQELEAVIGVQRALILDAESQTQAQGSEPAQGVPGGRSYWQPLALAASVVLAVFSTTMYWRSANQAAQLEAEIDSLGQPWGTVLTVPLDIMRNGGGERPDVIVRKPPGQALIVFDIEVSESVRHVERVRLTVRGADGDQLLSWSAQVDGGRIRSAVAAERLPGGRVWLEIANESGNVLDHRLIEFR